MCIRPYYVLSTINPKLKTEAYIKGLPNMQVH